MSGLMVNPRGLRERAATTWRAREDEWPRALREIIGAGVPSGAPPRDEDGE